MDGSAREHCLRRLLVGRRLQEMAWCYEVSPGASVLCCLQMRASCGPEQYSTRHLRFSSICIGMRSLATSELLCIILYGLQEQPQRLAQDLWMVLALLAYARSELLWYFAHVGEVLPAPLPGLSKLPLVRICAATNLYHA